MQLAPSMSKMSYNDGGDGDLNDPIISHGLQKLLVQVSKVEKVEVGVVNSNSINCIES